VGAGVWLALHPVAAYPISISAFFKRRLSGAFEMVLIVDPYANRHLSRDDIRLVNRVAEAVAETYEDIDPGLIARAIDATYRTGMQPVALKQHVERHLALRRVRG